MNLIIPFTKDIRFSTNISQIVSISLEHEYTVNSSEILGNFIITGEYKTHEVSVNKEKFEHVVPFSVNLTTSIEEDSVDFAIEDFTYEIVDDDTLKINIEYSVNAIEAKEEVFETVEDDRETFDEMLDIIDEETQEKEVEVEVTKEELKEENKQEEAVLESVSMAEESFVTYHIHVMSESDTIESICTRYNTNSNVLGEYNDLSTVAIGDKIIIPDIDE